MYIVMLNIKEYTSIQNFLIDCG